MAMTSDQLAAALPGPRKATCVVGVGNRLKGDDAAGPRLVDALQPQGFSDCIDAGIAPENHLEAIAGSGATVVLIADAMDFGGAPGDMELFSPTDLRSGISTHALSIELLTAYLRQRCSSEVWLVGIQPKTVLLGASLSQPVAKAVRDLARALGAERIPLSC